MGPLKSSPLAGRTAFRSKATTRIHRPVLVSIPLLKESPNPLEFLVVQLSFRMGLFERFQ